jgi:hypothetical protein
VPASLVSLLHALETTLADTSPHGCDYAGTTLIFAVCPRWASAHLCTQMPRRAAVHVLTTPADLGWLGASRLRTPSIDIPIIAHV